MTLTKTTMLIIAAGLLTACEGVGNNKVNLSYDGGFDHKPLSQLKAGIWVDPYGCDHWIIDDGVEGYLSARLTPDGKPVCSGIAPPNHTSGDFRGGSIFKDVI